MRALVWALLLALCACGTRLDPTYSDWYKKQDERIEWQKKHQELAASSDANAPALAPAPAPPLQISGTGISPQKQVTKPKQPISKGGDVVDGAIVCPSLDTVMWLYKKISSARVARTNMPPQNRQMVILQDGYDPWAEPKPADYRCQFVPAGTPMNIKWESGLPVVWGKLKDGRPFAGVTNPSMVDY